MTDPISNSYAQIILEQAISLGDLPEDSEMNLNNKDARLNAGKHLISEYDMKPIKNIGKFKVYHMKSVVDGDDLYSTVDPDMESHHYATFKNKKATSNVPFDYSTQDEVQKYKNTTLPKSHVMDIMNHHMEYSNTPLVTGPGQTPAGHALWRRFASSSLSNGKHVYSVNSGKITKITNHVDLLNALDSYRVNSAVGMYRHIAVSNKPIEESN